MPDIRDLCDHNLCMCGQSYIDIYGYWRTYVPHPGLQIEWYRLDERERIPNA